MRADGIAVLRAASSRRMVGDFPPSSSVTRFMVAAPSRMMLWPTATDPVNEILSTSGFRTSSAPTVFPRPITTLQTPFGSPAASMHSSITPVCSELSSLGLMTTVQPAATADASLRQMNSALAFHAVIRPATPTGSKVTVVLPQLSVIGSSWRACSAAGKAFAPDSTMSLANRTTPPYSSTIAAVRSSMRDDTARCSRRRASARCVFVVRPNPTKARLAAAIARRVSSSSPSVTRAMTVASVGRTISITSWPCDATNAPSM